MDGKKGGLIMWLFGLFCLLIFLGENPIVAVVLGLVILGIIGYIVIIGGRDYKRQTGRSIWEDF